MPKIKGTGIDAIKSIVRAQGEAFENDFLEKLEPKEREEFLSSIPISWRELNLNNEKNQLVYLAEQLYPGDSLGLQKVAMEMAKISIPRFYQIFIRIPKPAFVFKRIAVLWRSFYDTGDASIEDIKTNEATFVLRNFPEYSVYLREYLCGYLKGTGELMNIRDMEVTKIENDPNAWKWHMRWK
jgi:hypothetical protein